MADTNLRQKHFSMIGWILWGFWVLIGWLGLYQHASLKEEERKMPTKEQGSVDVNADQTASVDSTPLVLDGSENKNGNKHIEHPSTIGMGAREQKQSDSLFSKFRKLFSSEQPRTTLVVPQKSEPQDEIAINFERVVNGNVWIGKLTHEERKEAFNKKDWFRVLELVNGATNEQIQKRKLELLAWLHPDKKQCTLSSEDQADQREWIRQAASELLNPTDPVRRGYRVAHLQLVQKGREQNQRMAEQDRQLEEKDRRIKKMVELMKAYEARTGEDLHIDEILNGTYDPEKDDSNQSSTSTQGTEAQGFLKRFSQALRGETTSAPLTVGIREIDDDTNTVELDTVHPESDASTRSNTSNTHG